MSVAETIPNWYDLCQLTDVPVRGSRRAVIEEKTIGLFRTTDNTIYAIDDECPHKHGPLSQGIVHDNCVTCPLHNWVIDLRSGEAVGADSGSVKSYPVKIVDGRIQLLMNSDDVVVSMGCAD